MEPFDPHISIRLYRMIFADIDGTLVDSNGELAPRTIAAIRRARAQERILVLCTGRSRHAAQKIADALGGEGYGIVLNGAVVLNWHTGEILRRSLLPARLVHRASDIAHKHGLACIWLGTEERDNRQYAVRGHPMWHAYVERNGARIRYIEDLAALSESPASLVAYGPEQYAESLARAWQQELGADVTAHAGPTAVYRAWYAQLTCAEATKADAAAFLANYLHVPRAQTVAIGDHRNDIGLLQWAGFGICMGDGHPEARAAADYVTAPLADDGAALALEWLIFD